LNQIGKFEKQFKANDRLQRAAQQHNADAARLCYAGAAS
jgi:hypothetical protein